MDTIKIVKSNYFICGVEIFRNKEISARSMGVYCYLRSHADGYKVHLSKLYENFSEGRDAIRKSMNELEEWGYIKRTRVRLKGGSFAWDLTVFEASQKTTIDGLSGYGESGDGFSGDISIIKKNYHKVTPPTSSPKKDGLRPLKKVKKDLKEFISIFPDRSPTARKSLYELAGIIEETLEREVMTRKELLTVLRECRAIRDNWTADNLQYKRGLKSILQDEIWKDAEFWDTRIDPAKRAAMNQAKRDQKIKTVKSKRDAIIKKFIQRAHHGEDLAKLESELYARGLPHSHISDFTTAVKPLATA